MAPTETPTANKRLPKIGDVWKDLDPRLTEETRYVLVIGLEGDSVQIQRVRPSSAPEFWLRPEGPRRWANAKRFNGKRGGYGHYR